MDIDKKLFYMGDTHMPVIKDESGEYRVVHYDELDYTKSIPERVGENIERVEVSDGWEKDQKVIIQGEQIFIRYLTQYGYYDVIAGVKSDDGVIPRVWQPNEPMGWKHPEGSACLCQWCMTTKTMYNEHYNQYICPTCYDSVFNIGDDGLSYLPAEDIDEW